MAPSVLLFLDPLWGAMAVTFQCTEMLLCGRKVPAIISSNPCPDAPSSFNSDLLHPVHCIRAVPGCPITEPWLPGSQISAQKNQRQRLDLDLRFTAAPDGFRDDTAGRWMLILRCLSIPKASEGWHLGWREKKDQKIKKKPGMKAAGWQTD